MDWDHRRWLARGSDAGVAASGQSAAVGVIKPNGSVWGYEYADGSWRDPSLVGSGAAGSFSLDRPGGPWLIHGSDGRVHWLYIKHPFRRRGLAKHLIQLMYRAEEREDGSPPTVIFTHKTKGLNEILHQYRVRARKGEGNPMAEWVFDPYKLWLLLPEGWWK